MSIPDNVEGCIAKFRPHGLSHGLSCRAHKEKAATGAALERLVVCEVLSLEPPPEDPDADQARAEEEEGGGFGDGSWRIII